MIVIYKYPLSGIFSQILQLPKGSKIITVQPQDGKLMAWAAVMDKQAPLVSVKLRLVATGEDYEFNDETRYINTVQIGSEVWHIFEEVA